MFVVVLVASIIATYIYTSTQYSSQISQYNSQISSLQSDLNASNTFNSVIIQAVDAEELLAGGESNLANIAYSYALSSSSAYNVQISDCKDAVTHWNNAITHHQSSIQLLQSISNLNTNYSSIIPYEIQLMNNYILLYRNNTLACQNYEIAWGYYLSDSFSTTNGDRYIAIGNTYIVSANQTLQSIYNVGGQLADLELGIQPNTLAAGLLPQPSTPAQVIVPVVYPSG